MEIDAHSGKAYAPVPFDPALEATRLKKESPTFARDAQAEEFEALGALLGARKRAAGRLHLGPDVIHLGHPLFSFF